MAGSGKKPGAGSVPEDDLNLWRKVTQDAKPLAGRRPKEDGPAPAPKAPVPRPGPAVPVAKTPELAAGAGADVDKRTADRLKRGKLPIDGKLDLHGMTQAEAERALGAFLADTQADGRRCVLVVTGKGPGREGGVLRRSLPQWLNHPANRHRVVAFATAQPRHGGHGAVYVLLKRQRDG